MSWLRMQRGTIENPNRPVDHELAFRWLRHQRKENQFWLSNQERALSASLVGNSNSLSTCRTTERVLALERLYKMADRYLEWLETIQAEKPQLKDQLGELSSLYQKKLWHQLTLALERDITAPEFLKDPAFLPELYKNFIIGFAYRLSPLSLAMIAEKVARQYSKATEAGEAISKHFNNCLLSIRKPKTDQNSGLRIQIRDVCLLQPSCLHSNVYAFICLKVESESAIPGPKAFSCTPHPLYLL